MAIFTPPTNQESFFVSEMSLKNPTLMPDGLTRWVDVGRFRQGCIDVDMPAAAGSGTSTQIWAQVADRDPEIEPDDTLWPAWDLPADFELKNGETSAQVNWRNIVNGASPGSVPGRWSAVYKHLAARYLRLKVTHSGSYSGADGFTWSARFTGK